MTADGDVTSSSISSSLNFPPVLGMGFSSQLGNNDSHSPRTSRRSILNPGGPSSSQAHNIAGEVISGFSPKFSSWMSSHSNSLDARNDRLGSFPPPPITESSLSPSPRSSPSKRIRAQTWDAMSGRLSPTGRSISMKSFGSLDNHSISGSESSFRASSPRPGRTKSLITMLGSASNSHDASYGNPDSSDDGSEESKHEEGLDATVPEILPPVEESHVKEVKGQPKGILRENQSDLKDSRVRFDEGNRDLGKRSFSVTSIASTSSRPGFSAKLPALTTWDRGDHDSGILSPTSAASSTSGRNAYAHRLHSKPSLLSKLNPLRNVSWSLIGACIVRSAPCFWCSKKVGKSGSATDREILLRLNILVMIMSLVQVSFGLFHFITVLLGVIQDPVIGGDASEGNGVPDDGEDQVPMLTMTLWSLETFVYFLSIFGVILLIACLVAQKAIRNVNLGGNIRFMWVLLWLLPIQIFCAIGLFDYYNVNYVTTKHRWLSPTMVWVRDLYCEEGTSNGKCTVPIDGGEGYESEDAWCKANFDGATDCTSIRNSAQNLSNVVSQIYYTCNGIWAILQVVLMWTTLCVLQAIITAPLVQRSRESNIPLWLSLPIVGCYTLGILLILSPWTTEVRDLYVIAITYVLCGGAFSAAMLIGVFLKCYTVLNSTQRRIKQTIVVFFNGFVVLTIFACTTIFAVSLIYSVTIIGYDSADYSRMACFIDVDDSCTGCPDADESFDSVPYDSVCPEWTDSDVQRVVQTTMKQSATVAAIFLVYALVTLRYGLLLFQYVSQYKIEYV